VRQREMLEGARQRAKLRRVRNEEERNVLLYN
jgi:hypothetical protein